jgi:hypothetical protein
LDSELARKIETLTTRLDALEQRLGKVERHTIGVHSAPPQAEERPVQDDVAAPSAPAASPLLVPLIGRTSLVLAGAFLLRTLTETDVVPSAAGTALGIVYAILWLVMAYLAAAKGRRDSATFHGLASAIIAFPLLWEATVKFGFLSPVTSAGALVAFTSLGLGIATHKSLRRVAWVIALGAAVTALVLAVATKALVLFVACLLALGCATLWLGYVRGWTALGWLIATVVDAVVLLMTVMPLIGKVDQVEQLFRPASLVSLQLALVVIYVGSFLYRSIIESADVTPAEIAQGVAVLVIGLGGALAVTRATDGSTLGVGLVGLLLGAGSYGASFVFIDRRGGSRWNFVFYTTLALVFMLVGFEALLGDAALALAYAVVALVTAWLGGTWSRATLSLHGAVFASAAAVASGLLAVAVDAFTGPDVPPLDSSLSRVLMILAVVAACAWFPVATHGRTWGRLSHLPKLLILTIVALGLGGVVLVVLARQLLPGSAAGFDAAPLAALRTVVLSVAAVLLALAGRWHRTAEAAWLVYPVLIAGAVKLLMEDVPAGRPGPLVVSLAVYGGAMILSPRLVRKSARRES